MIPSREPHCNTYAMNLLFTWSGTINTHTVTGSLSHNPASTAWVFILWSPWASLCTKESFSRWVILLLLSSGIVSIITFSLSISFEKEFLAALATKCPEIQGFGSFRNNSKKETSSRLLVGFFFFFEVQKSNNNK